MAHEALIEKNLKMLSTLIERHTTQTVRANNILQALPDSEAFVVAADYIGGTRLLVDSLEGLKAARAALRTALRACSTEARYRDRVSYISAMGTTNARAVFDVYDADQQEPISIVFTHPIDGWPLKGGPHCGFRQVHKEYDTTEWTCGATSEEAPA